MTGKGGVGKSTSAALIGLHAASLGKKVLVVHPEGSQPHAGLWGKELKTEPQTMAPGLDVVLLESEEAMREYSRLILKSQTVVDALFHSKVARGFLTGMPGLTDWAILGKTWSWTRSGNHTLPVGQTVYDLVILDAPASGDGSKMLKIPQVILDLAPIGRMHTDARACQEMLTDERRSGVLLVSLAEELSVTETEENLNFIRQHLGMPLGPLLINQVLPRIFSDTERAAILASNAPVSPPSGRIAENPGICLTVARTQANREKLQETLLTRLSKTGLPLLQIPKIDSDLSGVPALKKLQMALAASH